MKANIFEIKRFAVHDGDGIRTTVFFKGCPLKCVWCHNPEGISYKPQLALYLHKCSLCGECVKVCPANAHKISDGKHIFEKEKCMVCGKCEETCYFDAITLYGKKMSVDEVENILIEDMEFYENSGGGITLSGGECLMYPEFCRELLQRMKKRGIHTAVDTSGYVKKEAIDTVIDYTDIFLYDIKAIDEEVHRKCTGHSNKTILENLIYIDTLGKKTEIRIPYVPGYNDGEIKKIGLFIKNLKNVTGIRVLPYHNYARSKYESLGMENTLPENIPEKVSVQKAQEYLDKIICK